MVKIRSALSLGLRPSAHILRLKNPARGWSVGDHALAEAYQSIQDETCPECGNPVWVCRSPERNLMFPVSWDICRVTQAREQASESKKKKKPWEFAYVRPRMRGSEKMPTRDQYYEALAEERSIHEKAARR